MAKKVNIAWTARDGFIDMFPMLSKALESVGFEHNSYYMCHHRIEGEALRKNNNIESEVLSSFLKENWAEFDLTPEETKELENKYSSVPLARCLWPDRCDLEFDEEFMEKNLVGHIKFWEKFLDENEINVLIGERPSILATNTAWIVCKRKNIKFLCFIDLPIFGNRITISENWYGQYDGFKEALETVSIDYSSDWYKKTVEYLERFTANPKRTEESIKNMERAKESAKIPFNRLLKYSTNVKSSIDRNKVRGEYYINAALSSVSGRFKRWVDIRRNLRGYKKTTIFKESVPYENEDYFLMPLHMLGEWSDYAWMGLEYAEQNNLAFNISQCLPLGNKLYVKEHTGGFGQKPVSFYKSFLINNRVKLVSPYHDPFPLIKNCRAVMTLGSSMGFEALMMGKPVILLGDSWYADLPGVYRANTYEEVADLMQRADSLKILTAGEKLEIVYTLFEVSFKGHPASTEQTLKPENLERLATAIKRHITLEESKGFAS